MPPMIGRPDQYGYLHGSEPRNPPCTRPPRGWVCTRPTDEQGRHDGPCAARPAIWNLSGWWWWWKLGR